MLWAKASSQIVHGCFVTKLRSLHCLPPQWIMPLIYSLMLDCRVRWVVVPYMLLVLGSSIAETNIYIYIEKQIYIYILRERDKYLYIYRETNIYIYWERERERKSKIFFPREFHKILGYHRRNKGKNYVNFCDQMAGSWWYDWENHGICYHQILWKRKRNNCVNINPHTWELHILNFSLKFSFKICYSQVQSVKLVFIS